MKLLTVAILLTAMAVCLAEQPRQYSNKGWILN